MANNYFQSLPLWFHFLFTSGFVPLLRLIFWVQPTKHGDILEQLHWWWNARKSKERAKRGSRDEGASYQWYEKGNRRERKWEKRVRGSEFILYLHVHSKNSPKIQMIQNLKVLFLKEKTLSFSYSSWGQRNSTSHALSHSISNITWYGKIIHGFSLKTHHLQLWETSCPAEPCMYWMVGHIMEKRCV